MKQILILAFTILISVSILKSQTAIDKEIERIGAEKVKFDIKELIDAYKNNRPINVKKNKNEDRTLNDDGKIAESEVPESEVHAAINPIDPSNIVVSPIRQDYNNPGNALSCPVYYTTDMGLSWNESNFVTTPHKDGILTVGGGDPVFTFDNKGRAYLSWIVLGLEISGQFQPDSAHAAIYWAYSDDKGKTWTMPENNKIYYKSSAATFISLVNPVLDLGEMGDKQWMATDLTDGEYANTVYTTFVKIAVNANTGDQSAKMFLAKKRSENAAFDAEHTLISKFNHDLTQFGSLDVDGEGNIHTTFYALNGSTSSLYHNISTDGGKTFGTEKKITDFIFNGGQFSKANENDTIIGITSQRLYPSPYMTSHEVNGNQYVYIAWTADGIGNQMTHGKDIYFARSTDGGVNWEEPYRLNNDDENKKISNFYPNITTAPDGKVIVSWYDRRKDNNDVNTDHYIAISNDNGQSFGKNQQVSTQSTDFETVGLINQGFGIGEYNAVVANDEYAFAVWADGRSGTGNLDVYFAKISLDNQTSVESVSKINSDINITNIYPNPVNTIVNFEFSILNAKKLNISIKDINGNTVLTIDDSVYNAGHHQLDLDISSLSSGNYYLHIEHKDGFEVRKINIFK